MSLHALVQLAKTAYENAPKNCVEGIETFTRLSKIKDELTLIEQIRIECRAIRSHSSSTFRKNFLNLLKLAASLRLIKFDDEDEVNNNQKLFEEYKKAIENASTPGPWPFTNFYYTTEKYQEFLINRTAFFDRIERMLKPAQAEAKQDEELSIFAKLRTDNLEKNLQIQKLKEERAADAKAIEQLAMQRDLAIASKEVERINNLRLALHDLMQNYSQQEHRLKEYYEKFKAAIAITNHQHLSKQEKDWLTHLNADVEKFYQRFKSFYQQQLFINKLSPISFSDDEAKAIDKRCTSLLDTAKYTRTKQVPKATSSQTNTNPMLLPHADTVAQGQMQPEDFARPLFKIIQGMMTAKKNWKIDFKLGEFDRVYWENLVKPKTEPIQAAATTSQVGKFKLKPAAIDAKQLEINKPGLPMTR